MIISIYLFTYIIIFLFPFFVYMIRNFIKNANPITPAISNVETLARRYTLNNQQVLRNTERVLRVDPATRQAIDRNQGLANILTRNVDANLERSYLTSFVNLQQSLFIGRVTDNDFSKTPTLEEMYNGIRGNNGILTSIKNELDNCCSEIKLKIDEFRQATGTNFNYTRQDIVRNYSYLRDQITQEFRAQTIKIEETFERVQVLITVLDKDITDLQNQNLGLGLCSDL